MLVGRHLAKALTIADSLTEDVKILALTEAATDDWNTSYGPLKTQFRETTVLTPCTQPLNGPEKSAYHFVLMEGSNAKGLNFSLNVASLFISVSTIKDSDGKLGL